MASARVLWSLLRFCCLAHLLLFCNNGLSGGIRGTAAEETTNDILDMDQGQEYDNAKSKSQSAQNVAEYSFNELRWLPNQLKEINLEKRVPMGFTGLRGKKDMDPNPITMAWQQNMRNNAIEERLKKTQAAFYGVRGKKHGDYDADILPWELSVQLQKQNQQQQERDELLQEFINRWEENSVYKRAPVGFTGMRGKRYYDYENEKRSLNNAFMGVRGKKDNEYRQFYKRSLSYDQPDVIGRRRFPVIANKFVAVRGKKDRDFLNPLERYFVNMWPALSLATNDKRAPIGFVGMRGKRDTVIANKPIDHHI